MPSLTPYMEGPSLGYGLNIIPHLIIAFLVLSSFPHQTQEHQVLSISIPEA